MTKPSFIFDDKNIHYARLSKIGFEVHAIGKPD
jgi:hypothetical protein